MRFDIGRSLIVVGVILAAGSMLVAVVGVVG